MTAPEGRRAARPLLETRTPRARHARARRAARIRVGFGIAAIAALVLGGAAALTAAVAGPVVSNVAGDRLDGALPDARVDPIDQAPSGDGSAHVAAPPATALPVPTLAAATEPSPLATPVPLADPCTDPAFVAALKASDDAEVIALSGGAELFRALVASGRAACVPLDDPTFEWVVVNKHRPYDPLDFRPAELATPKILHTGGRIIEKTAAKAMSKMVSAAAAAGAGQIGVASGFRSYGIQVSTYNAQVASRGRERADLLSARPGYSEHQSGLAADVAACRAGCGSFFDFEGTDQEEWVVAHSWEYGWIVRYEHGCTDVTGYQPEPWHLRYIGPELARAYHEGGWHTLEEFFGLEAAPDYLD